MRLAPLSLRSGDRAVLESWCRSGTVEARFAKRARIVLLAADGVSNREIGELVDMHYNQVAVWRRRYSELGVAGLGDEERPGRLCVYDHDDVLLLVKTVTEPPPDGATRWTMEALAGAMNRHGVPISASQVWRICRALDLKPWQVQSWMTSHDPDFWERAGDVCGLYLNPPDNVVVWSVDEKTGIQATSRVNPTRPAVPGIPVRREFEYRRHCIADNLKTHSTDLVDTFLQQHPHVHLHFTPTHASWLNQVELLFSILQRRLLRRGEFDSVDELADRVIAFIKDYNRRAQPFRWTYDGRPLKVA